MYRIFNTLVIKLVIRKEEKDMMIHTVLVAEQFWALRSLVKRSIKEAQDNTVVWKNVNNQIFYCLPNLSISEDIFYPLLGKIKSPGLASNFFLSLIEFLLQIQSKIWKRKKVQAWKLYPNSIKESTSLRQYQFHYLLLIIDCAKWHMNLLAMK